jgi:hypothetical protein
MSVYIHFHSFGVMPKMLANLVEIEYVVSCTPSRSILLIVHLFTKEVYIYHYSIASPTRSILLGSKLLFRSPRLAKGRHFSTCGRIMEDQAGHAASGGKSAMCIDAWLVEKRGTGNSSCPCDVTQSIG